MTTVFGIKNCDSIKKARKWLEDNKVNYSFHDYRVDGIDASLVKSFFHQMSWQELINKRSTTYRNLSEEVKNNLDENSAIEVILEQPTLLKRPIIITHQKIHVGFKAPNYQVIFGK